MKILKVIRFNSLYLGFGFLFYISQQIVFVSLLGLSVKSFVFGGIIGVLLIFELAIAISELEEQNPH
ncbi:hypothetical protein Alexa_050 [Acinetobacter phage vB_AbaP_Alexa]|nr:hypothetical protein Alexa_050 [Acinetobacter phage vB_AbaP_Alexa]